MATQNDINHNPPTADVRMVRDSTVRDILYVLFRNKGKIISVFVLAVVGSLMYAASTPRIYESEAEITLKLGSRSNELDPTVPDKAQMVLPSKSVREEVNSEIAVLQSDQLARKVVDKLGPERILSGVAAGAGGGAEVQPSLIKRAAGAVKGALGAVKRLLGGGGPAVPVEELAVQVFRNSLYVMPRKDSNNIYLTMDAVDPKLAQEALDLSLKVYQDLRIQIYKSDASPEFFTGQTHDARVKLASAEDALKTFKSDNSITSLAEQKSQLLTRQGELATRLSEARTTVADASARVQYQEQRLKAAGPEQIVVATTRDPNPLVEQWQKDLSDVEKELPRLRRIYNEGKNTPLDEALEKVKMLQGKLSSASETKLHTTTAPNLVRQQVETDLHTAQAQLGSQQAIQVELEKDLSNVTRELERLTALEPQLAELERERGFCNTQYDEQVKSERLAGQRQALDLAKVSNVGIVQAATLPVEPIKPKPKLILLLGMMMGLFGGVALAFGVEYLDQSIKTTEDVEKHLGLPVLATVAEKEFKKCI